MVTNKVEPWIETYSGKKMYFLNPTEDMIDINDIAHALSFLCRFGGHISRFFSVAQHCVGVSNYAFQEAVWGGYSREQAMKIGLQGLLHDAAEAYLTDCPTPIKRQIPKYSDLEEGLWNVIMLKYGLSIVPHRLVSEGDTVMLRSEARVLLPSKGQDWLDNFPIPEGARNMFIHPEDSETSSLTYKTWFNFYMEEINEERKKAIAYA